MLLGKGLVKFLEDETEYKQSIINLIAKIIRFYKGAITYSQLLDMPISELEMVINAMNNIITEENKQLQQNNR